jgi:hypothetical protein
MDNGGGGRSWENAPSLFAITRRRLRAVPSFKG